MCTKSYPWNVCALSTSVCISVRNAEIFTYTHIKRNRQANALVLFHVPNLIVACNLISNAYTASCVTSE